ncbi:MAG TPA: ligase-associated DNA damage response endonuclease PdeM [Hyphomicrobiaceae bacterium]|nr:ligase-associated DNA damage response endonuclease PdeM [Hyphomicrobiaceae bacterium]
MHELRPDRGSITDYGSQLIEIGGKILHGDMTGALWWPSERALIVADLHLEKASFLAMRGQPLPPYDTRETLQRVALVLDRYEPELVVALGDSLHDRGALDRIGEDERRILTILQEARRWVWITGNHDGGTAAALGGEVRDQMTIAGLKLRHEPRPGPVTHEIAGHLHPAARLSMYGHAIRRPCFVGNGLRLVLPAFGTFTGGLNVLDEAFTGLFRNDGMSVWMLGQEGVYPVATRHLKED